MSGARADEAVVRISWALVMAFPIAALDGDQTKAFEALLQRNGLRPPLAPGP